MAAPTSAGRAPDVVFVGGCAFTAGWQGSRPLGVAVRDGRVVAVEADHRLRDAGARRVVELEGGVVMPAFHDAHAHPVAAGIEALQCDVSTADDAGACLAAISRYADAHPDLPWVQGAGWTMSHFPGGTPTAAALDAVVPDRPAALLNRDHHGVWVNTEAMRRAGITAATPDPAGGRIERDADGEPSGVLHEGAARLLDGVAPPVDDEVALQGLLHAQRELLALGVVGWQDAWVGATAGRDDLLDSYLVALERGLLRVRVTAALWWEAGRGLEQLPDLAARRAAVDARQQPDLLLADTVKIMVDGVAENSTAAMSLPYRDACGHPTQNRGLTFLEPADLRAAVVALDAAGFQVHFHALGDRAVTTALDALEAARSANGPRPARHQLAHLQVVQRADVARFARLGATANLQMLWGGLDEALAELTFPFLPEELVARHYPFRELRDAGAELAAGSDWPVSSADPLAAVHVAVNRAQPGETADPRMDPGQSLGLTDALVACTAGAARANGRGATSGRLEPGMLADLVVLDADPFSLEPERIHERRVVQTWLGGALSSPGCSAGQSAETAS